MVAITVEIDPKNLRNLTPQALAAAWHIAQANPAPHGDWQAAELVKHIGWEIIRRWLADTAPEMHHHQADAGARQWLGAFAKYEPPADAGSPGADFDEARWHSGRWTPRDPKEVAANLAKLDARRNPPPADTEQETTTP